MEEYYKESTAAVLNMTTLLMINLLIIQFNYISHSVDYSAVLFPK